MKLLLSLRLQTLFQSRRSVRSSVTILAAKQLDQLLNVLRIRQMLGKDIGKVLRTFDLAKGDGFAPHLVLQPQALCVDVPKLA